MITATHHAARVRAERGLSLAKDIARAGGPDARVRAFHALASAAADIIPLCGGAVSRALNDALRIALSTLANAVRGDTESAADLARARMQRALSDLVSAGRTTGPEAA